MNTSVKMKILTGAIREIMVAVSTMLIIGR